MSKFSVGEIVIVDGPIRSESCFGCIANGDEVTLLEYDPSDDCWRTDRISTRGKPIWGMSRYFRKRPQQDDNLFTEWFQSHIITDIRPTETQVLEDTMRRVRDNISVYRTSSDRAIKDSPQGVREGEK